MVGKKILLGQGVCSWTPPSFRLAPPLVTQTGCAFFFSPVNQYSQSNSYMDKKP